MSDVQRRLAPALYFLAFLLVVTPVADFGLTVAPYRFGNVTWRFAAFGLFSGFLLTPLLGIALAVGTAAVNGHRGAMRVFGICSIVMSVVLVVALMGFALDSLQVRRSVPEGGRLAFQVAALKALVKHVTALAAGIWLGIASLRAARALRDEERAIAREARGVAQPGFFVAQNAARE